MTRARQSQTRTNGTYGVASVPEASPEILEPGTMLRRSLAILGIAGNLTDAQTLYYAVPGATAEGWAYFERLVGPLRTYVLDGEPGYFNLVGIAQYEGTPTPTGDCAEDGLPLERQNPDRAAAKSALANGESHDPAA